jgi:hypothetical protein
MREVRPYRTVQGAKRALDNGGRFFNVFAQSGDDRVDSAELARAAGVYSTGMRAFLYFEMALMELPSADRPKVVSRLSPDLESRYQANRSKILIPSSVESEGQAGIPAIVTGYSMFVEDRTQFAGFIVLVVPIITLIPIFDQFDVYEVFDTPEMVTPRTVIATARGSRRLDGVYARFGGVLKELYFEDKTGGEHGLYLETMYYTPLG